MNKKENPGLSKEDEAALKKKEAAEKKEAEVAKKKATPEKEKSKLSKLVGIVGVPLATFDDIIDEVLLGAVLPKVLRYVSNKTNWKPGVYRSGYTLGAKLDDATDRLLRGRGELAEDPLQEFIKVFTDGIHDGADKDEGVSPQYPLKPSDED